VGAIGILQVFGEQRLMPGPEQKYYCALLEELRASASQMALEQLSDRELSTASAAARSRLKFEKRMYK